MKTLQLKKTKTTVSFAVRDIFELTIPSKIS